MLTGRFNEWYCLFLGGSMALWLWAHGFISDRSGFQLSYASRSMALGNSIPLLLFGFPISSMKDENPMTLEISTHILFPSSPLSPPHLPFLLLLLFPRVERTQLCYGVTHTTYLSAPSPLPAPQSLCQTWVKWGREGQIPDDSAYMWNL